MLSNLIINLKILLTHYKLVSFMSFQLPVTCSMNLWNVAHLWFVGVRFPKETEHVVSCALILVWSCLFETWVCWWDWLGMLWRFSDQNLDCVSKFGFMHLSKLSRSWITELKSGDPSHSLNLSPNLEKSD